MKFRRDLLAALSERIHALRLTGVPRLWRGAAGYRTAARSPPRRWPLLVGARGEPRGSSVHYAVFVACDLCAHLLMFDAENFDHGDEPISERA